MRGLELASSLEQQLQDIQLLRERVATMEPILCGYKHEWRGQNGVKVDDVNGPLCKGESRVNNPACAHCLALGMRQKMKESLPWLTLQIDDFRKSTYENRGANAFSIELQKAIECEVFPDDADVLTLGAQFLAMLEEAIAREQAADIFIPESEARFESVRIMIHKIFDPEKRYGPEIGRLQWYVGFLRNLIDAQDRDATNDAQAGVYDEGKTMIRQQFIVEQLELVKQYLLDAIDQKLTALRSGN